MHHDCKKKLVSTPKGTLRAWYVVLILDKFYLPSEPDATLGIGLALTEEQWEVAVFEGLL